MILRINTTIDPEIGVSLLEEGRVLASLQLEADRAQAEKLLPLLAELLKKNKIKPAELEAIEAVNQGDSFTSLRIGVATANALGFAWGIPVKGEVGQEKRGESFSIVEPFYNKEPNIT